MYVDEQTEDRLVLKDTQLDKKIVISLLSAFLLLIAFAFADGGDWIEASIPAALAAGALVYLKLTLLTTVVTFDRARNRITMLVTGRKGREDKTWKLKDLVGAEVVGASRGGHGSGRGQPVMILKDGRRVPLRPYRSAGAQSWNVVVAIRRFIGQEKTDDLPIGWIPDD